ERHPLALEARLFRETLVTGVAEPRRRLRECRAALSRPESIRGEGVDGEVLRLLREPGLPPETVVQGHIRGRLPRVLRVEAKVFLRDVLEERCRLPVLEHPAEHEVSQAKTGDAAVEAERTSRSDIGSCLPVVQRDRRAER